MEHSPSWKIVKEQLRSLWGGAQLITPKYRKMFVMAGHVYEPLGERLEARYRRLQNSKGLIAELTFASDIRNRATELQNDHQ